MSDAESQSVRIIMVVKTNSADYAVAYNGKKR